MRTRPEHQEAVTRRLALLRAEIEAEALPRAVGQEWWDAHTHVDEDELAPVVPLLPTVPVELDVPPPGEHPTPVVVPVPGRHAARRRGGVAEVSAGWMPDVLRGRLRLGHGQLTVIALLVASALALTSWWLVRGRATTVAPTSLPSAASSPLVPLAADTRPSPAAAVVAGTTASASAMVTVDVEGKVRHPGIVIVPAGSRVTDALAAAGGIRRHTALGGINLAAVLVDGQQIVVGAGGTAGAGAVGVPASGGSGAATGTTAAGGGDAPVDLNTATAEQLDTLPGVGPVTAQAILEWREQNGAFTSVQELLEVDGIGPATLAKLTPHVTV